MSTPLDVAIDFAAAKHRGQYRDGAVLLPYITHPLDVLTKLLYVGQVHDMDLLVAAVLHDTIEECGVLPEEIEELFGQRVRELVMELTRYEPTGAETASLTPDERWELRSKLLIEEIERMSPEAQSVKLADRLSNLAEARWSRTGKKLERYVRQTAKILKVIPKKSNAGLWEALKRLHAEVEASAR